MFQDVKVLDVHAHVSVPQYANAFLAGMLAANSPLPSPLEVDLDPAVMVEKHASASAPSRVFKVPEEMFYDAAKAHVDYIDARQIDVQLIGPRPYLMLGWMEPHILPAWSSYVNDLIAQQCRFFPDRFIGACQLPQIADAPDLTNCIAELDRCVNELGFAGAYVSPDVDGRRTAPGLDQPYWYPLYKRCVELGVPIIVHGTNTLDPRLRVIPHNYQTSFVIEQYVALQCLRWSDVFDRFPELKVVICHCGGALDRFYPGDKLHLPERDTSNNIFFDTAAYDERFLEAAIKIRGIDQMCFGVEAPGSGFWPRSDTGRSGDDMVPVIDSIDFLTSEDKVKIFNTNPARVCPALGAR